MDYGQFLGCLNNSIECPLFVLHSIVEFSQFLGCGLNNSVSFLCGIFQFLSFEKKYPVSHSTTKHNNLSKSQNQLCFKKQDDRLSMLTSGQIQKFD